MSGPEVLGTHNTAKRMKLEPLAFSKSDQQLPLSELLEDFVSLDAFEFLGQLAMGDAAAVTKTSTKMTKSTKRKRSYEQRKEELDILAKQAKALEAKLDYLKHRAGVPDQQNITQQTINNGVLRELLRNQQYLLAGLKSSLSENRSEHAISPISTKIRLGRDPIQRRATLQAMRYQKLHDATRFMEKRTQFNKPARRFSESTQFQDEHGNTFASSLDIFQLHQAKSVKQVYDAVLFNWFNLEIRIADLFGDVALREEDDTGAASASHHRLVFYNRDGVAVETNSVGYSEYKHDQDEHSLEPVEEAIFVNDFVEEDELYPYRPQERVRKDVTAIITIKLVNAPDKKCTGKDSDALQPKPTIVLMHWVQWQLHTPEFEVPKEKFVNLTEEAKRASPALLDAVSATIRDTSSMYATTVAE